MNTYSGSQLSSPQMSEQVQLQVQDSLRRAAMFKVLLRKPASDSEIYMPTVRNIGVLFLMTCAAGLTVRLALVHTPKMDRNEFIDWQQEVRSSNAKGFFLDIGASGDRFGEVTSTRSLESLGWRGVCVDPFPRDLENRACKIVKLPVAAKSGDQVSIPDCSDQSESVKRLFKHLAEGKLEGSLACPMVDRSTIGISELLELAAAPRIIDFVSLDTEGSELQILQAFPFEQACVRAWQVKHGFFDSDDKIRGMRAVLEPRGCHFKDGLGEVFVQCPCENMLSHKNASFPADRVGAEADRVRKPLTRKVKRSGLMLSP